MTRISELEAEVNRLHRAIIELRKANGDTEPSVTDLLTEIRDLLRDRTIEVESQRRRGGNPPKRSDVAVAPQDGGTSGAIFDGGEKPRGERGECLVALEFDCSDMGIVDDQLSHDGSSSASVASTSTTSTASAPAATGAAPEGSGEAGHPRPASPHCLCDPSN